jgi:hypothetical protein
VLAAEEFRTADRRAETGCWSLSQIWGEAQTVFEIGVAAGSQRLIRGCCFTFASHRLGAALSFSISRQ